VNGGVVPLRGELRPNGGEKGTDENDRRRWKGRGDNEKTTPRFVTSALTFEMRMKIPAAGLGEESPEKLLAKNAKRNLQRLDSGSALGQRNCSYRVGRGQRHFSSRGHYNQSHWETSGAHRLHKQENPRNLTYLLPRYIKKKDRPGEINYL